MLHLRDELAFERVIPANVMTLRGPALVNGHQRFEQQLNELEADGPLNVIDLFFSKRIGTMLNSGGDGARKGSEAVPWSGAT